MTLLLALCLLSAVFLQQSGLSAAIGAPAFDFEEIASFTTVDFLWDDNHTRSLYQENGQFVVANNAITGVKVSRNGDVFVNVPRWMSGVPSSLNKLVSNPNGPGYVLQPWPSWEFNAIGSSGTLQYAQSMIIDSQNRMWIPEVGRTNFYDANPSLITTGRAGVLIVDIDTGALISKYYFPENVVSYNNSFVNDIVLDEATGFAYFTNTWADGGIIVYDSVQRKSKMFKGMCTQRNYSYDFCANGLCYGTNGVGASPSDGIALSADGTVLYFSPVQGNGLFGINTSYLQDFATTDSEFQRRVKFLGYKTGCSDGLLLINNNLYYGNIQDSSLGELQSVQEWFTSLEEGTLRPADSADSTASPSTLNWIDTFSIDFNDSAALYFSTNRLNLFFTPNAMDFTGQSGANFRLYHATPTPKSGASRSTACSTSIVIFTYAAVFISMIVNIVT